MYDKKDDAQDDTEGSDDEVRDAEERVLPAEPRRGRENHALVATERGHRVV